MSRQVREGPPGSACRDHVLSSAVAIAWYSGPACARRARPELAEGASL